MSTAQTAAGWPRPESLLRFGGGRRLPVLLQTEASECGLVCLAMIAGYHGYTTDIVSLRQRFVVSSHGTNLKSLIGLAGRLQLATRALRLEVEQIPRLQLPAILHWDLNHFVVLKQVRRRQVIVHDPAMGERRLALSEFSRHFTGVALELSPTDEFQPREDRRRLRLGHFWSRISGFKRSMAQVLLLALMLQLFAVVSPYYMQTVVDDVLLRNDANLLLVLALGFGLLLLIQTATGALREFVIIHLSNRLSIQMAANLFRHLIRLPLDYFQKRHMGDIVSRFGSLGTVQNLLTTGLIAALVDGILAVITLSVMCIYSLKLSLIVLVAVLVYAGLRLALYRPLRLLSEEAIVTKAKQDSHFMESVRAIQTIKLFQRENDRQGQWHNLMADSLNKGISIARWNVLYTFLNGLLTGLENLIVVYVAATAVMANLMTIGMLFAFISYKNRFVGAIVALVDKGIELKMLSLHLERLADIAFTPAEPVDRQPDNELGAQGEGKTAPESLAGDIEARNLGFRYSELEDAVFSGLNFHIRAGETVALTGPSGCGKTTLLKCLMGLLSPTEGEILIDGRPLRKQPHYRRQVAGVMQDDSLMSGSIADNIACFSPELDLERVKTCARQACIHGDIAAMPMQYNTLVGDMGANLSGGQYQRLLLARALYRRPRILFLDEATSHLDIDNEAAINHQVGQLDITRVIVAHRPETLKAAERRIHLPAAGPAGSTEGLPS